MIHFLSTSRYYRSLVTDQSIWHQQCARYGVHDLHPFRFHDANRSYYSVYTALLHKYGPLLGVWASDNPFQGSVLSFRIVSESREVGWEGIIGEVWHFQPGAPATQRTPMLPDYYECLRIELLPNQEPYPLCLTDVVARKRSSPSVGFAWVVHNLGPQRKDPIIRTSSTGIVQRNERDSQAFHVCTMPSRSGQPLSLHPVFPPPNIGFLDDATRLPPLKPHDPTPIDHRHYLSSIIWDERENVQVLYLAPSDPRSDPHPPSITILPPVAKSDAENHWQLLLPARESAVVDMRSELYMAYSRPFMGHFFPMRVPHVLSKSRDTDRQAVLEEPKWTPQSLEGLWLGAYSTDGTEVLFLSCVADSNEVQAWKVTGNSCVPRGALSWKFNVSAPISQTENTGLLSEMGLDLESGSLTKDLHIFEGTGVIADEGFMSVIDCVAFSSALTLRSRDDTRGNLVLEVAVIGRDDIRIRWTYEDGNRGVLMYKRYVGRDVASETVPRKGVRRSATIEV